MRSVTRLLAAVALLCGLAGTAWAGNPPVSAAQLAGPGLTATAAGNQLQTNSPPIVVTGTTYTITAANCGQELHFTNAGSITTTLPAASAVGTTAGCSFYIEGDLGAGLNTVAPTSGTINGGTSILIGPNTGSAITSDGANWRVSAATALIPGATGSGINQITGDCTTPAGNGSQPITCTKTNGTAFGTAATVNLGTSGTALGYLNGANTYSGVNTFSAAQDFTVPQEFANGTMAAPSIYGQSSTQTGLHFSTSSLVLDTNATDRACAQSIGFIVGSYCAGVTVGTQYPQFQIHNNSTNVAGNSAVEDAFATSASVGALFNVAKSSSATLGTQTAVANANFLGAYQGDGSDGATFQVAGAVQFYVDGAVSTGIVPGRIVLATTNAAGTLTQGLLVDHYQDVALGTPSLAVSATGGFPYFPTTTAAPTGTPTAITGEAAHVYNTTTHTLNIYDPVAASWYHVTLTAGAN